MVGKHCYKCYLRRCEVNSLTKLWTLEAVIRTGLIRQDPWYNSTMKIIEVASHFMNEFMHYMTRWNNIWYCQWSRIWVWTLWKLKETYIANIQLNGCCIKLITNDLFLFPYTYPFLSTAIRESSICSTCLTQNTQLVQE